MDETTQNTENLDATGAQEQQGEQGKWMTQAQLDAIVQKSKAQAKKPYADYDELKAKAAKLDELEEASKSDLQKATERISELEKQIAERAAADERAELIDRIATDHKVPSDYRCFLTAPDEDGLVEQAQKLAEKFAEPSFNEGKPPAQTTKNQTNGDIFAAWVSGQL